MTTMHPTDVVFRQRVLGCSGFYTGKIDGAWGPLTDKADQAFHAEYLRLQTIGGTFDPRTESTILTLITPAQSKAREFMRVAGATCKLISGTRSYAEQDALFGQRPKVTNARGGQSNHNFGIAWDVGIFQNGHYLTGASNAEDAAYVALSVNIKAHVKGLDWGGDWHSIVDKPHYQLATGKTLAQVRAAFEAGKPFT
jgi:peptidoglycan L-alanyl-D-glutamate endopeptidase CwlK